MVEMVNVTYGRSKSSTNALGQREMQARAYDARAAQFLLLNLARAYRQAGLAVKIVLLEGGPLVKDYAEVAQIVELPDPVRNRDEALQLLRGLRNEHAEAAIANTTVSGSVTPLLREAGYSPVALIHEMRSVAT